MASQRSSSSPAWRRGFSSPRSVEQVRQSRPLPGFLSGLTTTRRSTRQPTCNISRGSAALGSASTGGMTADWSQGPPCFGQLASNDCPGSLVLGGVNNISMGAANVGEIPLSADQESEAGSLTTASAQPRRRLCLSIAPHRPLARP